MPKLFIKIILPIFFWGVFAYVVMQIPYPETLIQADIVQIFAFFIPLFFGLIFTFNIFLKSLSISGSLSLGIIFLLVLKALDSFNVVTAVLIILAVGLLLSYFRKPKGLNPIKSGLTSQSKIPKLTTLQRRKRRL